MMNLANRNKRDCLNQLHIAWTKPHPVTEICFIVTVVMLLSFGECFLTVFAISKGRPICLESRYPRYTCSSDFTFPPGSGRPRQPATIDPTLDLCIRYPLRLGGPRQCGIRSLPNTSTHGQHWESNPRPSGLEFNTLSSWSHAPSKRDV